jgi:hypothetical protein
MGEPFEHQSRAAVRWKLRFPIVGKQFEAARTTTTKTTRNNVTAGLYRRRWASRHHRRTFAPETTGHERITTEVSPN